MYVANSSSHLQVNKSLSISDLSLQNGLISFADITSIQLKMASSSLSAVPRSRKGGWTYDVFLSFRGEDTRNNFVDHLFSALVQKGIHTFKDDKMLGGGQPISEKLLKAIRDSRFAVVVFSKNYANSSWCLEELSNIMECHDQLGQKVLPVFYHVDPSDVRKQNGDFATAFETHEDKFKGDMDKVNKWRDALTAVASLSGQHILPDYGGESTFINKIVQQILANKQPLGGSRENHLIGIKTRINSLISLLRMQAVQDVRIVGICGMGGIGKTTIARALFNRIAHKFEGSSFVSDVRENSSSKKDMCNLQERVLNNILGEGHGYKIEDRDQGAEIIQERCSRKKVLLVLDDVNDVKQLEFLAATREWFGPGSRIIITTRDQHLLSDADETYKPATLSGNRAVELFCRHAFNKRSPPEGFEELSIRAIQYVGGLPLALKVLGSFFRGRKANLWESALKSLAKTQDNEIFNTLKLSFDYLNDSEKQIFLDIVCFYRWKDVDDVTLALDCCGFEAVIGISVLIEKSLITISLSNTVNMHDLIQDLGQKVLQATAPNSRLWELEKIHKLIKMKNPNSWLSPLQKLHELTWKMDNREVEVIEGIVVPREVSKESLSADVFKSMKNLRILHCNEKFTCRKPSFLPNELRWFCWNHYPFSSLPVAHMSKLVWLEMKYGKIKHLWKVGEKIMLQNLKFINLEGCKSLIRFPDVSGAPNIESLKLFGCENLVEVDESVGSLKKLVKLDIRDCNNLKRFPSMLKMESLEILSLHRYESLKRIPEFSPCMVKLSTLDIRCCPKIEEVPSSINYLSNLKELCIDHCSELKCLPSMLKMETLETLVLYDCPSLKRIPEFSPCMVKLSKLDINGCPKIEEVPSSINYLSNLKGLWIADCSELKCLPSMLKMETLETLVLCVCPSLKRIPEFSPCMVNLSVVDITSSKIEEMPSSITYLPNLKELFIGLCFELKCLPSMLKMETLETLTLSRCDSLKRISEFSPCIVKLSTLDISRCPKIEEVPSSINSLSNLKELRIAQCSKLECLPSMLNMETLETLNLSCCDSLKRIPEFSPCMVKLSRLNICRCPKIEEVPSSINYLSNLKELRIDHCSELKCLPSMLKMETLETLNLSCCDSLKRIPEFSPCMVNLSTLNINGCPKIEEVPSSINYLFKLKKLDMSSCFELKYLPSMLQMKSLGTLLLCDCPSLKRIPEFLPCMVNLSLVDITGCSKIEEMPSFITYLPNLFSRFAPPGSTGRIAFKPNFPKNLVENPKNPVEMPVQYPYKTQVSGSRSYEVPTTRSAQGPFISS